MWSKGVAADQTRSAFERTGDVASRGLKAENEILKRQLAAAEARAAREAAKAEWAIGEFSALTRRLRARAAERASRG